MGRETETTKDGGSEGVDFGSDLSPQVGLTLVQHHERNHRTLALVSKECGHFLTTRIGVVVIVHGVLFRLQTILVSSTEIKGFLVLLRI
jgi:hypothetical protein